MEKEKVIINGCAHLLCPVTNERILSMCAEKKVFVPQNHYIDKHVMYYCARKIMQGKLKNQGNIYIDILIYNNALNTIGNDIYNRSIGHLNDVNEIEIHQVLAGKVLELIEYQGERYIGIFREGDYFEIPAGAFHCTYILEDITIVANIFGNVFWESNYSKKPYYVYKNSVSFSSRENKYLYQTEEGDSILFDDSLEEISKTKCKKYSEIIANGFSISRKYNIDEVKSIFELFNYMIKHT